MEEIKNAQELDENELNDVAGGMVFGPASGKMYYCTNIVGGRECRNNNFHQIRLNQDGSMVLQCAVCGKEYTVRG